MRGWCILSEDRKLLFADAFFCDVFTLDLDDIAEAPPDADQLSSFVSAVFANKDEHDAFKWVLGNEPYEVSVSLLFQAKTALIVVQLSKWQPLNNANVASEAEEDANIGSWSINFMDDTLHWSPQVYKIYGLSTETTITHELALANYSESSRETLNAHIKSARLGTAFSEELDFYDDNSHYKRVLVNGRPVFDANNEAIGIKGTLQDISKQYFMRRRNELAVEVGGLGIWELQHSGELIWNQQMAEMYEFDSVIDLKYKDWEASLHPDDYRVAVSNFQRSVNEKKLYQGEFRIIGRQTGETKHVRAKARHFFNKHGELERTVGVNINVTHEYNAQQEQLLEKARDMQKSKFIALGEMAAGIGHEINNPLAILQGNVELLEQYLSKDMPDTYAQSLIGNIQHCVERIENISGGLRRLVRDDTLESYQRIDINAVLESTVSLLQEIYAKEGIKLSLECGTQAQVMGHFSELQQVFLNLLTNARDALAYESNKQIQVTVTEHDANIEVCVKDNGSGIAKESLTFIFDSLYTEKPSGKGTGLGLGLCKRIVTEHSGDITVKSELGEGAAFTVTLPKVKEKPVAVLKTSDLPTLEKTHKHASDSINEQRLRVVVIDDEPMILQVVSAYLKNNGVRCYCTSNVEDALEALRTGMYHMLITDLCMPELSGSQLLDIIQSENVHLPVIVMTGGVYARDMEKKHQDIVAGFLYKPFDETALMREVEKCRSMPQALIH